MTVSLFLLNVRRCKRSCICQLIIACWASRPPLTACAAASVPQYCVGLVTFLYPRLAPATRAAVLPFHTTLGLLLTVLPTLTALLGILERMTWTQAAAAAAGEDVTEERLLANSLGIAMLLTTCSALAALVHRDSRQLRHWQQECGTGEGEAGEGRVRAEGEEESIALLQQGAAAPLLDEMVAASLAQLQRQRRASREHRDRDGDRHRAATPPHYGSTQATQAPPTPATEERQPAATQAGREATEAESSGSDSDSAPHFSMWATFKGIGPQGVILQSP